MVGGPAAQAVDDGRVAAARELALQAPDLAGAELEQPCGLGLGALAVLDGVQDLEDIALPEVDPIV